MKLLYLLHGLLYAYLLYLGLDYLEVEANVIEELSRTRWSVSRDVMEMVPTRSYTEIWVWYSIGTLLFAGFLCLKAEIGKGLIVGGLTGGIFFMLGFNWLIKANLNDSCITFVLCGSLQIGVSMMFLLERWIASIIDARLKQFFFVTGILYIGILALRFWSSSLTRSIAATIEEVGRENYTGMDIDVPGEIYLSILLFVAFFVFVLHIYYLDKDDDRLNKKVRPMLSSFRFSLFFSYQFSNFAGNVVDNNGIISSSQLFEVGALAYVIICSFTLFTKVENKKRELLQRSDVLDDWGD